MTRHTPGAWRVETGTHLIWGCCDEDTPDHMGYPVAFCSDWPSWVNWHQRGIMEDEKDANARLIASAPDLLAALKAMVLNMKADHGEYRDCYKAAEAAIAKATQP